ncbi:MAG: arginine--tRNA ligase [Candidatus Bathyarchaeota archaeon]|nr:arginine--tRNA ligase [Candidatus Bathyarchaeota archaeon]
MVSVNPFAEFRVACETALQDVLSRLFPKVSVSVRLDLPPSPEFGELSSSICFEIAKQTGRKPLSVAKKIVEALDVSKFPIVRAVKAAGEGYVNFYANFTEFSLLTIESIRDLGKKYGYVKVNKPAKIIVEHTSANPIHPIHIGQARNPMLGDAIARILKARGHTVFRHYYVDDVGRQAAAMAYGYEKLGKPKLEGKPDHFIGVIYTITSCLIEVHRLKKEIGKAREHSIVEEVSKLQRELDDWMSVAVDLEAKHAQLFNKLAEEISKDEDPESKVARLIREYEAGEENAKLLIREISQLCMGGFKETLGIAGISFDSWDWESGFVWNSDVKKVLSRLEATPYVFRVGRVLEFDADKVAQDFNLKQAFGLREDYEIPSLTLVRADGSTLYTTRDIPYTLWKFQKAERVINVIGMEQPLAQLQLKLALCALGHVDYAKNLTHFAYNLVRLPGFRMESRKGRYITLDKVINEAVRRAYEEVSKRSPRLSEEEKRKISNFVGIGALKYALVEVDPSKPVVFTWDRVLDFEKNSAPYIQYSHARAGSIMRKAARGPKSADYALLKERLEHDVILMLARFPEVFIEAADNLKPNLIADFANALADKFNTFYNALPVLKAKPPELSDARLALVEATKIVLSNALNLLGIEAPERM